MATKFKLTKRTIEALKPRASVYEVQDTDLQGFQVRVHPDGRKVFYFYYRNKDGVRRRPAVGDYHPKSFPIEKAREKAGQWFGLVAEGKDPSAEKQLSRSAATVADLVKLFMEEVETHDKPTTAAEYRRQLEAHFLPKFGNKKLAAVTTAEMHRLHSNLAKPRKLTITAKKGMKSYSRVRGSKASANRVLATIRAMFNKAEVWKLIPPATNPTRGIKLFKEKPRSRYLTPDELERLAKALDAAENEETASTWTIAAIRLLIYTGARKSEILTLKWEHVDADAGCLRLPDSKTGEKVIFLNKPAADVLEKLVTIRDRENPWVICSSRKEGRLVNLSKPWTRIHKAAGIENLRLHDLRHVFGGTGAALGLGLTAVGALLGHRNASTTMRYSNMAPSPLAAANEQIGQALAAAMAGSGAKVVELTPKDDAKAQREHGS